MIPFRLDFLLFTFLVLGCIPFIIAVKNVTCHMDDNGVKYVDYKGDCEIGGYEEFLKKYKDLDDIQVHNAILAFNCKLCDPRHYLECYKKLSNETNSTQQETSAKADVKEVGECDCLASHQDGYIFVYDKAVNQCRGGVNSMCDLSIACHASLKCEMGTCLCPEEGWFGCKDVPLPRLLPEYESNGAVRLSSYQNHGPFICSLLISIFCMKNNLKYFILETK